ncbi:MAG: hypothetical protein ACXV8P_08955 [Methylobacter sp.]
MQSPLQNYPNLASLVQSKNANTGTVSLASSTGATIEAIQLVDQQVAAINYAQIQGGFEGADEMYQAIATMKNAAAAWPSVKSAILAAAQETVNAGPAAASLGDAANTVQQIAIDVKGFVAATMNKIISDFASAKNNFDTFNEAMDHAYSVSANANQAAANAIQRNRLEIDNQIQNLNAEEEDLRSAGSIIIGIFSLGISYAVEIEKLEKEANQLRNEEQQQQYQENCYQASLGSFKNALDATKLASYALSTLSTSLQQSVNSVNDIAASTSDNLIVMQAQLQQFKTEFAAAVTIVRKLMA